ncbi:MAG: aspartate/glutamate racemase family protein [Candidatus Binatia bacterium]
MRFMFLNHSAQHHSAELEVHIAKLLKSYASPDTTFELAYPEDLGSGAVLRLLEERKALSGLHHILETPALVKKAIEAERQGFDAVIQSNTFDPGVEASRLAVRIPVIGLLRASLHFAASICDRFGLIVPLETHMPHTMRMVQTYGMTPFVSGIRTVGLYDTGDLSGYHDVVIERTLAVGKELVAQGAQAIIPLGGKIYPYVVTPEELEPHLGVPVINTKAVGVSYAELMARNRITHSIRAYPCPTGLDADAVSQRST